VVIPAPAARPDAEATIEPIVVIVHYAKLLSVGDLSTLGHLCSLHGKIVQLWAAGESPTGHMLAQYNTLAGSFGLAPAPTEPTTSPVPDRNSTYT
jgi:hypothetical protein